MISYNKTMAPRVRAEGPGLVPLLAFKPSQEELHIVGVMGTVERSVVGGPPS